MPFADLRTVSRPERCTSCGQLAEWLFAARWLTHTNDQFCALCVESWLVSGISLTDLEALKTMAEHKRAQA